MTDKKFTDEEILKALEEEIHLAEYVDSDYCSNTEVSLLKSTLDLINRQKSDIERLKSCVKSEDEVREIAKRTMEPLVKEITREQIDIAVKLAKAEAYKEFAERLENEINCRTTFSRQQDKNVIHIIHNLLKEMVGEEE